MAQSMDETTWFNGVTWVDVCTEAGNSTNKISYTADVYSNKTEKNVNVVGGYELKLGLLLLFPTDIILDILSRLPVEDLIRGRIICKSWYKLTKDPQFIHLQVSKATRGPHSFLLDETNVDRGKTLILVDMENDKWRSTEIMFKTIYKTTMNLSNSCNGLVCISANFTGYDPVIHNLLTKDCLILPNSDYKPHQSFSFRMTGFGIGFDSMNKKYKVVRVIYEDIQAKKFHTKAEIITLGESSWRILNFPHTVTTHSIKKPVFLYGALHWLIRREKDCSHSDHVLVLDCINETFETINFPPVELPEDLALINLGETLALSELSERGLFNSDVHRIWQIVGNR
ncbi:hypothetical protein FRX31_029061 [Thalictrum thalictroides]|uniref:F-box domain-containing protein n=1 Tax=Thalictrum thalictroides TaxID=46969 RepID=A0A7J6VB15_THATH|nr:hypothetical protein FRX31_029061 [Thalictrum thalictroides]